ncbi:hypothetical protein ON010_g2137 [Phytophthora cinnamomi]|nr:hypothetical protein ON010_g2137 [Phytophthora cinnamomi]
MEQPLNTGHGVVGAVEGAHDPLHNRRQHERVRERETRGHGPDRAARSDEVERDHEDDHHGQQIEPRGEPTVCGPVRHEQVGVGVHDVAVASRELLFHSEGADRRQTGEGLAEQVVHGRARDALHSLDFARRLLEVLTGPHEDRQNGDV